MGLDNQSGSILWEVSEGLFSGGQSVEGIIPVMPDTYIICGTRCISDFTGPERAFLMKISTSLSATTSPEREIFTIYPNPTSETLQLTEAVEALTK